jgi:hypothetical protein
MRRTINLIAVIFCVGWFSTVVCAQPRTTESFDVWLGKRAEQLAQSDIKARITQRNSTKQSETPSISSNTTSLVDKSSASDLVGVGLNLAGLETNSHETEATSMSATVSAYALKAAAAKRDPLDPAYYNANRDWRRVSFTLGFDYPEESTGNINDRATIFGIKYLPYDKRDASDVGNQTEISEISNLLGNLNVNANRVSRAIQEYVLAALQRDNRPNSGEFNASFLNTYFGPNWGVTYDSFLTQTDRDKIDEIIKGSIAPFVTFTEKASEYADQIRNKPQIALSYMTKQRRGDRPDDHAVEAIFDLGLFASRVNLTLNAGFNYTDNKLVEDNRGGRVAAELQVQLTRDKLEGRMPVFLTFSGDGCWMTNVTPMYRAQAKISIPLAPGVEIPLSVTYASRTDLIKESDVRGKFGITFDVTRIAQAFSGGLLGKR